MPKRELWPAGLCSEPVTHIGSCGDMMSTTSTHSGSSDSSYDFLSAEEKECLLFLEKTIGSLEAEADSGLSTDESEPATSPQSFRALPTTTQQAPQGKPEATDIQQVPVPKRVAQPSCPPESHSLGLRAGSYSLPRNLHLGRSQNLRESATQANSPVSEASEVFLEEPEKGQTSQGAKAKTIQPPAPSQKGTLDLSTVLIPPPEAFQDISPKESGEESPPKKPGEQTHTLQVHSLERSPHSQKRVEMSSETVSHKATEKGWTEGPHQPQQPPAQSSQPTKAEEELSLPSGVKPSIQQTPLTASKARKLPPNIVLKSSRSSFHSHPQNWLSNHTEATDSGPVSSLQEQRKARREALEKLGLPQDQDDPSLLVNKHTSTLKVREALPQTPSQARAPARPASPALVSGTASAAGKVSPKKAVAPMDSLSKGWIPTQETPPGKVAEAKSMPIPIPKTSKENSSRTQPKPDPRLTLQESSIPGLRQMNFKSNTLERSGVGLSSYLSAAEKKDPSCQTSTSLGKSPFLDKVSPSAFRNSRPRPASLGMGKDFAGIQGGKLVGLEQDQCSQQPSFKGQSYDKLPRPPCISVKISPKGIPDGHRREALKKLGLLKE